MKKSVNVKKKDKLKIFSILAGFVFILIVIAKVVINGGYELASAGFDYLLGYTAWSSIIIAIVNLASPLLFAFLALLAALILFIKKDSAAVFIPVGLLTYNLFGTFVAPIINIFFSRMVEPGFQLIATFANLAICLVLATIVTVLFFVAAVTFCKKHRYILMFLLFAAFVVGALLSLFGVVLGLISNIQNYLMILEYYDVLGTIFVAIRLFVLPIAGLILNFALCFAVLLAAIGMISRGNKKKADALEIAEAATIAEAAETVETKN